MVDPPKEDQTNRPPSQNDGLAVWGLLLLGLTMALLVLRKEFAFRGYLRKLQLGKLDLDKYVDELFWPAVGVCIYIGRLVGMGLIILSAYRAIRALVTR